jgi:rod shape-determining protein MreC
MPRRRNTRAVVAVAVVLAALGLLLATGVLRPVTGALQGMLLAAAGPLYGAGAAVSRASTGGHDGEQAVIDALRVENAKLLALAAENDALKGTLGFKERSKDDAVLARVVSRTSEDVFHGLVIDRGADDGVAEGQPVVFGDGVIIGKVAGVKARSAAVLLLTDSRSRLAVSIENAAETAGVLEGDRGLSMAISLIPQTETLAPGDAVITSGIEPGVRRGLVVGTVEKVQRANQDPFQSASVAAFDMASDPTFVQVLRGTADR